MVPAVPVEAPPRHAGVCLGVGADGVHAVEEASLLWSHIVSTTFPSPCLRSSGARKPSRKSRSSSGVYRQDSQLWTAFGSFCTDMAKTPYPRRLYSSAYLHIYLAQRPQYSGRSFPPPVRSALSFIYAGGDQGESIA